MAWDTEAGHDPRGDALAVLTTGVVGDPVAVAVTHALITDLTGGDPTPLVLDGEGVATAWKFAEQHRIRGIARRVLPGTSRDAIAELAGAMAIERRLLETVTLLDRHGITALVLKGNATARLDHATPADREVGDVDLLVQPDDLTRAMAALERSGAERVVTHPFRRPEFFHSETFVTADGNEIDLHHRLAQPSRAPRTCWRHPETFVVGGTTLLALPRSWRFLHTLVHQMMNPPPSVRAMNGLTDLVVMWTRGIDLGGVRAAAEEIGLADVAEHGLRRVSDLLGQPLDEGGSEPARRGLVEKRFAPALDRDQPTPGYLALAANLRCQPLRTWPAYVTDLVWPSAPYRHELGVTVSGQIRHVVSEALGR